MDQEFDQYEEEAAKGRSTNWIKSGGIGLLILAVLLVIGWGIIKLVSNSNHIYFSTNFIEENDTSDLESITMNQRLVVTYESADPIRDETLSIRFSKFAENGKLEFYESQARRVMADNTTRLEFPYQKFSFRPWGPGVYLIEIESAKGKILADKKLTIEPEAK